MHHVQPIEQRAAGPQLSIPYPSLRDPGGAWGLLAQHVQHHARPRRRLALEETSQAGHVDAAANGQESGGFIVGLADKGELRLVRDVGEPVGADEDDVQRRARLERVLRVMLVSKENGPKKLSNVP